MEYKESPAVYFDKSLHNLFVRRDKAKKLLDKIEQNIVDVRINISNLNKNKNKLSISEHAIDRFKERIVDIPRQKVIKLLSSQDIFDRYKEYGPGKYRLSEDYPNVILVIEDYTICTCYMQFDYKERLTMLKSWMDQWVDERVRQELGEEVHPIKLKTFRKKFYK